MKNCTSLIYRAIAVIATITLAAIIPAVAQAQTAEGGSQTTGERPQTTDETKVEEVIITGYRRSLEDAAEEKRRRTNFTDSIFAEDIGKFPDMNLAESLQRLPGIQIERDASGEGTRVNIRGLGSQFAILSMNGAQLETASDPSIGSINDGRGSSLDLLPTELFRSLTISKTPMASQIEGGIAGNVELRPIRPFDNPPGLQVNWQLKGMYQDVARKTSPRAGVFVSDTWDGSLGRFGILAGAGYADKYYRADTFNNVGDTTFSLGSRCPASQPGCNSLNFVGNSTNPTYGYGGGASIPATVPAGMGFGYANGAPLTVCGPGNTPGGTSGLSCDQLGYVVIPRLARAEIVAGERKRTSGLITSQWQPTDALLFNLDLIYAKSQNDFAQHDLMIMLRSTSNNVPFDVQANDQNILTHATFANAQFLSENRPFSTAADFLDSTLGMNYQVSARVKVRGSVTFNDSSQDQSANTVLLRTPLGKGYAVTYDLAPGATTPKLSTNFDPRDPNLGWQWDTLRVQPNRRNVKQKDAQLHVEFTGSDFVISSGAQFTKFDRLIESWDTSACATNAVNGMCSATSTVASQYPGAIAAIPNSQLGNYMMSWPYGQLYQNAGFDVGLNNGWAVPDYQKIASAVNINYFENLIDPATRLNTYNPRTIDETTKAGYIQVDGDTELLSRRVRYNAGVRAVKTNQQVSGIVTDPTLGRTIEHFSNDYLKFLPSFNAALDLTDALVFRLAGGRTMTRPNPGDLAPALSLSLSGDALTVGNPALKPYFSNQVDLGLEWYISKQNTLALNLWQKRIEGFTSIYRTTQRFDTLGINFNNLSSITQGGLTTLGGGDPNAALVNVEQRQNTPEIITLRGLELSLLQPLDFLLRGLGVAANYTRVDQSSKGAPAAAAGQRQNPGSAVTGLSPNTYNLSVYLERGAFSGRLSYNYRDAYVSFLGPQYNIEGNGVAGKSQYLDASLGYLLPWFNTRVTFEAQNLLNQIQLTTMDGNSALPFGAYAPGRTYVLGVSGRF